MKYNLNRIISSYEKDEEMKFLFFWSHRQAKVTTDKCCLSQWFPSNFIVDGLEYNCSEQFMMAEKARLFGDTTILEGSSIN